MCTREATVRTRISPRKSSWRRGRPCHPFGGLVIQHVALPRRPQHGTHMATPERSAPEPPRGDDRADGSRRQPVRVARFAKVGTGVPAALPRLAERTKPDDPRPLYGGAHARGDRGHHIPTRRFFFLLIERRRIDRPRVVYFPSGVLANFSSGASKVWLRSTSTLREIDEVPSQT